MKHLLFLLAIIVLFATLQSCTKNDDCTTVEYDTPFTILADEAYCLPDGSELLINSLNNEFCPCNAICVWEGQMTLDVTLTDSSGSELEGKIGTHQNITWPSEELPGLLINVAEVQDSITFVTDCTFALPSPEITQAIIVVRE